MRVPIVFCADKNYSLYLPVVAQSIIDNSSPEHEYHIITFDCGIKPEYLAIIEQQIAAYPNFKLIKHNIDDWLATQKFSAAGYFTAAIYGRLLIPALCGDYKKVIYADIDFIFNADCAELMRTDLGNAWLAGVADIIIAYEYYAKQKMRAYFTEILRVDDPRDYVNSGLLIFNIKAWREQKLVEKCAEFIKAHHLPLPDQDAINSICRGRIAHLPQSRNCILGALKLAEKKPYPQLAALQREHKAAYNNSGANLHYTGAIKPWHDPAAEKAEVWWHYARKTEIYERLLTAAIRNTAGLNLSSGSIYYSLFGIRLIRVRVEAYARRYYFFSWRKGHFAKSCLNSKTGERSFYLFGLKLWSRLPAPKS